ncbi:MAG: glycosyltransferase [Devosia sp.]
MRILRIIRSVDPATGGPIEGLRLSAERMNDMGHHTTVLCLDPPDAPFIPDFPLPVVALGPAPRRFGYTPALPAWLRDNARNFDAAILHGLWNYSSVGSAGALRAAGVPYFIFAHGMLDPWFGQANPVKHVLKSLYWRLLEGPAAAGAEAVLFTTAEERERAALNFTAPAYRSRVVAYAAGAPGEITKRESQSARRTLLFLGRLHPKKGCDLLIKAFASIAPAHPDLDLVIAGPDNVNLTPSLRALAETLGVGGRVTFPGLLTGTAKWSALASAEAFVLTSHQENFGIAVAEALAVGVPVLISDKVNIWREVETTGSGLVAPDTQDGALSLLTRYLALTDEQRTAMRRAARDCYLRHFTVNAAARDLEALLMGVVKTPERQPEPAQ